MISINMHQPSIPSLLAKNKKLAIWLVCQELDRRLTAMLKNGSQAFPEMVHSATLETSKKWWLKQPGFQLVDLPINLPSCSGTSQEFELPDVVGCVLSTRLKAGRAMGPCQGGNVEIRGRIVTQNDGHIMDDGRTTS